MNLNKDKFSFDPENLDCSDNIGVWIRDGYSGNLIGSTDNVDGDGYNLNISVFGADGEGVTTTTEDGYTGLDVYIMNQEPLDVNVTFPDTIDVTITNPDDVDGYWYQEDSQHVSGDYGNMVLAVRNDVEGTLVDADGDYGALQLDAYGRLRVVTDVDTVNIDFNSEKAEDSIHYSGDIGAYMLTVRADVLPTDANTSHDGDYASLFVNNDGALWVSPVGTIADGYADDGAAGLKMGAVALGCSALATGVDDGDKVDLAADLFRRLYTNTSYNVALNVDQNDIGDTAEKVVATSLSGRQVILIQNHSQCPIWIGDDSGVSGTNGFRIPGNSTFELQLGPCQELWAIAGAGKTADVRFIEAG